MSAATTRNTDTTNNAGFPPAPPEAHQKAGFATIALLSLVLAACSQAPVQFAVPASRGAIQVAQPKGEPGDFVICPNGDVITYPVAHPKHCAQQPNVN